MNNSALSQYVAQKNLWREITGKAPIDADNLNMDQINALIDSIEGDLSPENLTCDGELAPAQVRRQAALLNQCMRALMAMKNR